MKMGYVYIMTNLKRSVLYVGVTSNLKRRVTQHKNLNSGFTANYRVNVLIYYEEIFGMKKSIRREKQLKNWRRDWKWDLVKEANPDLKDLYDTLE